MAKMQTERQVEIITPLGEDVLLFHHMKATEGLGRMFEFELKLLSSESDIAFEDMLGQNVTVRLSLPEKKIRYFNGYVTSFNHTGSDGDYFIYSATVNPWLWFLTRTSDCRIFQNQTVPDIIKQVFRDHGYTDFEETLEGSYRQWEYCVQYRETDFAFVSRLLEHEGIYYYFKHEQNKHTLVLADAVSAHKPVPGYEKVPYYPPQDQGRRERDHISCWSLGHNVKPGAYAVNDYDFTKPKADIQAKSTVARNHAKSDLEIYDYPGEYNQSKDGDFYAQARIEEIQAGYELGEASGNARGMAAGSLFTLDNYPRSDQNCEYLIVQVVHEIQTNQYRSGQAVVKLPYTCKLKTMSSKNVYRPARATSKPVVQGPQTAVVVGKSGEEIWTDKYGRIKVQFYWDRYGKTDENSSCWVRVSHPSAGKGWGAIQIPRVGQEVIVDFLEGDPDRPIITGRVYNANQMPPFELPANGMVSGMKSNSTPGGGGYNEISMNDTKGKELITVHAQYNMDTTVENDQTLTVHKNRTTTIDVDDTQTVKGNQKIEVKGDRQELVEGKEEVTVTAAAAHTNKAEFTRTATGTYTLKSDSDIKTDATKNWEVTGGTEAKVTAPNIVIEAEQKLEFVCGESSIVIDPLKVSITSGTGSIDCHLPGVHLKGEKIQMN